MTANRSWRPQHAGHVYELVRTAAACVQVLSTAFILARVYGVL